VPNLFIDGQIFDAKSLCKQVLDLKKNISRIALYNKIKRAFSIKNNFLKRSYGHSYYSWRAKKCPQALGWAALI
jgi:hypothetical protein